jgi:3-dehydroquinate synthase
MDARMGDLHRDRIDPVLAQTRHTIHIVPAGEEHKSLDQAYRLYDNLLALRPERGDLILALGGGVIGDLAGFVAATLLRGIRFVQVPTTILSQVDSSVGGKVAVDHPRGKNLIGAFHQPSLVIADLDFIATLPSREVSAGLAEVVKIAVMMDPALFDRLEQSAATLALSDRGALQPVIRRAIELKAQLVEEDERDLTGARALLNYGHTLGQALEAATGYDRFLHGEAVAIGMGAAARIAQWSGRHPLDAVQRQDALLATLALPAAAPGTDPVALRAALGLDKKREGGALKWVLPQGIGRGQSGCEVPQEVVDRAIDWMLEAAN